MALSGSRRSVVCSVAMLTFAVLGNSHPACHSQSVMLESAQLGNTGRIGGTSITNAQHVGWRFEITQPLAVERVGGHLLSSPDETDDIFAALIRLSAIDAFPQGSPFMTEEIVATTTFRPNFPSDEILTPLAAVLNPGSYALVFGTNQFGATGEAAIHNGPDQPDIPPTNISSYIFWGIPDFGQPPVWRTNLASNMRFVIEGELLDLSADFDFDGDIDGRDFLLWQRGGSPSPLSAIDLADWQASYGVGPLVAASTAAHTAVPEPHSLVLALVVGLGVSALRKSA